VDTGMERRIQWPNGSFPDPTNWKYEVGGGGWGNAELEVYCAAGSNAAPCSNAMPNVFMDGNGNLVIPRDKDTEWNVDVHADENRGFAAVSIWPH